MPEIRDRRDRQHSANNNFGNIDDKSLPEGSNTRNDYFERLAQRGDFSEHITSTENKQKILENLDPEKPESYNDISKEYLIDREFMKEAIRKVPTLLRFSDEAMQNDLEFLKEVIIEQTERYTKFHPNVLRILRPQHRNNFDFMKDLMDGGIASYNEASFRLQINTDFINHTIQSGVSMNLDKIPEIIREDYQIIQSILSNGKVQIPRDSELKQLLPIDIVTDKSIWLAVAKNNPYLLGKLPEYILDDTEFVKQAIHINSSVYEGLPLNYRQSKEIAQAAYRESYYALSSFPSEIKENKSFLISLMKYDGRGIKFLPENLKSNPDLIVAAAENNSPLISELPRELLLHNPKLVERLAIQSYSSQAPLKEVLGGLSDRVVEIYKRTGKALSLLGFDTNDITTSDKIRFDASQEIIRNRWEVAEPDVKRKLEVLLGKKYFSSILNTEDNRKKVAIILPKSDHNSAFSQRDSIFFNYDFIDEATRENKALVYEVGSQEELIKAVTEIKSKGQVDSMILAAHGSPQAMSLGSVDPRETEVNIGDRRYLTVFDKDTLKHFKGTVKDKGKVILMSCSTGGGDVNSDNMATAIHSMLPETYLYAPKEPTTVTSVINRQTGAIEAPTFNAGFKIVESFLAEPLNSLNFKTEGLDPYTKRAVDTILSNIDPTYSFIKNRKDESLVELIHNNTQIKSFVKYDPISEKVLPLEGYELSKKAAEVLAGNEVFEILADNHVSRLWKNWSKNPGEPGYIEDNDPLLLETKEKLAKALHIDPSSILIDLSNESKADFVGRVMIRGQNGNYKLTEFKAIANLSGDGLALMKEPSLDLILLGKSINQ